VPGAATVADPDSASMAPGSLAGVAGARSQGFGVGVRACPRSGGSGHGERKHPSGENLPKVDHAGHLVKKIPW